MASIETSRITEVSSGKMPTTADLAVDALERVRIPYETAQMPPVTHHRPDARGVQGGEYGATVRDGGIREQTQAGQAADRSMDRESELVLGRPCDSPGCAASADP